MRPFNNIIALFLTFLISGTVLFAQDSGSVKGKVRSRSGDRIGGVLITARQNNKEIGSAKTNVKGLFKMSGLAPGRYTLVFERDGFSTGALYNVQIKKGKVNNLRDRLILTVDQGTLVIISGSVFNQFGRSVYGAKVTIEEIREDKSNRKAGKLYSSLSGQFVFRFGQGKKKFRITASAKNVSASKEIEVDDAAIYRLAITLNLPEKKAKNSL